MTEEYLRGTQNTLIRYYYYLEQGLNILNQFRNLGILVLGVYIALKLENPLWIAVMSITSVVVLTIVGYYTVHRVAKVREWLSIRFSTHYAVESFDTQKEILKTLQDIESVLKKHELH